MPALFLASLLSATTTLAGTLMPPQAPPSPLHQAAPGTEQQALQRAWTTFARAVQRHDLATVRRLSANCVFIETALPRPYISTTTFLKQQWNLVFDANTRARLLQPSCLHYNLQNEQNKHIYQHTCIAGSAEFKDAKVEEVLVTTIDPLPAGEEGMQKAFAFIKLRDGYKFCGYSTIP